MKLNGSKNIVTKWLWAWIQDNIDSLYHSPKYAGVVQSIKEKCQSNFVSIELIKRRLCDYFNDLVNDKLNAVYRRKKLKFIKLLYDKMKPDILYD